MIRTAIIISFCAFVNALFVLMIKHFMQEGMILSFYSKLLAKIPECIAKPLGECVFCFGFWVATINFITLFYVIGIVQLYPHSNLLSMWFWGCAFLAINNFVLRIIKTHYYND